MKRQNRYSILILIGLLLLATPLFAQEGGLIIRSPLFSSPAVVAAEPLRLESFAEQLGLSQPAGLPTAEVRLLNAVANKEYPLTPGDRYRLVYLDGMQTVTVDLQADEMSRVQIPGLGTVAGAGKYWTTVREEILAMVSTYYSYSNPQLVLTGVGSFSVSVVGEVTGTRIVPAWGLTRLSEVLTNASAYASTRSVEVVSSDGSRATYDLYRALRQGDLSEDPLLKSGDRIILKRADTPVQLAGNVYQSGTYQVLAGETLDDLLNTYGGGLRSGSDVHQIRIQRTDSGGQLSVQYVSLLDEPHFSLQANDQVVVDTLLPSLQSVTIEGAIASQIGGSALSPSEQMNYASNRLFYHFYPQETLGSLLRTISGRLLTISDLGGVYLERAGERTAVDVHAVLSGKSEVATMRLAAGDTLVIPFDQRFITIGGAVVRSGVYAYVPEKGINYYIALAGGLSDDASYPQSVTIYGPDGKKQKSGDPIRPESTITVKKNTFVKDLAPTVAVIGLVSSILGIVAVTLSIILDARKI